MNAMQEASMYTAWWLPNAAGLMLSVDAKSPVQQTSSLLSDKPDLHPLGCM